MSNAGLNRSGPTLAADYFPRSDQIPPEQRIWRAVIANAFTEIESPYPYSASDAEQDKERLKANARRWLTEDNESLRAVCDWAGLDVETVMRRAREIVAASSGARTC